MVCLVARTTASIGVDDGGRILQAAAQVEEWGEDEMTPFVPLLFNPSRFIGGAGEPCRYS
jgi:hypothetical protein